jgi:riboflavin synthase
MFNGIIESTGKILSIDKNRLVLDVGQLSSKLNLGDSLAVDGICLTVARRNAKNVTLDISPETWARTNLHKRQNGMRVNLELPITAQTFISGHYVQGHIEGVAQALDWKKQNQDVRLCVKLPSDLAEYCIPKGSIALNGVSLTIAAMQKNRIEIALIPYTLEHTNLSDLKKGDLVNVETDMIGRYVVSVVKNTYDKGRFRKR